MHLVAVERLLRLWPMQLLSAVSADDVVVPRSRPEVSHVMLSRVMCCVLPSALRPRNASWTVSLIHLLYWSEKHLPRRSYYRDPHLSWQQPASLGPRVRMVASEAPGAVLSVSHIASISDCHPEKWREPSTAGERALGSWEEPVQRH